MIANREARCALRARLMQIESSVRIAQAALDHNESEAALARFIEDVDLAFDDFDCTRVDYANALDGALEKWPTMGMTRMVRSMTG